MAIQHLDYWYDKQIKRFLKQIVRAFSGFQYQTGWRNGNEPVLMMVPCRLANRDRQAASIIRNNSENSLNTVPMITIDHIGMSFRSADLQSPTHIDTLNIVERAIDVDGNYTGEKGNTYTIERLMPRPFMMTIQIDIWTSNEEQKYQLFEQIATTMYPFVEIQNSDSALDWTAKTTLTLEDDLNWSSRSVPIGTENEIDIMTITGRIPIWLTPPAKVHQQRRIEQITTNISSSTNDLDPENVVPGTLLATNITTPGNHWLRVQNGKLTLLGPEGALRDDNDAVYLWEDLLQKYGVLQPTLSEIRIKKVHDVESTQEIIGTLQVDNSNPNMLFWQIDPDTLPANTLNPVDGVIDPLETAPGIGLPAAVLNRRYLLINDIGPSQAWGSLTARANDIIQFNGTSWFVAFTSASALSTTHYVLNLASTRQLRWDEGAWEMAIDGDYSPGMWRIRL